MSSRPTPTSAARTAMAAAANVTKQIPTLLGQPPELPSKPDGRRQRWERHKEQRRAELVDGALLAVREIGPNAGMDDIASHIGVSKTVLYRYFADKNDLNTAAMARFIETSVVPRLNEALTEDVDEYRLTRTTVEVYVNTVADEPAVYNFVMSSNSSASTLVDSQRLIAQMLVYVINARMIERGLETGGVETWAYTLVGAIQLATHWWMAEKRVTQSELIDYMTMMVWNAVVGVIAIRGSRELFNATDHPLPNTD